MNNEDIEEMKKLVLMVLEENRILREMLAKEWEKEGCHTSMTLVKGGK